MVKAKWATLRLHQLKLDQENYRLGPQKTQRDAIRAMIGDQGPKLVRMAKDILLMGGTSPGEPLWVVPSGVRGQYIVEEGNRRVTALKLMENPALADETSVARQFRRLSKLYSENPIRELDARIFASRAEVLPWKRRRHMTGDTGVGLASWKPLAKGRANRDEGEAAPRSLAVVELFEADNSVAWSEIIESLDNRWTTIDRILNTKAFRELLGVEINPKTGEIRFENGDGKAGRALLLRILGTMASPDFEFADVEKVEDRERFVARFVDGSVKGEPSKNTPADADNEARDAFAGGTTEEPAAARPDSLPNFENSTKTRRDLVDAGRATLAPPQGPRVLAVNGPRLGPLYQECRKLKVKGNENAAALLVRVFIELSSEMLLKEKNVPIPKSLRSRQITKWDDYKVKLADKILNVSYFLDPSESAKEFQQVRLAIRTDAVGPYSIGTLHAYFHNRHFLPDAASIKDTWDGWETYLREVHAALNAP